MMCYNVFSVYPKTTLIPVWPRDSQRLDTPERGSLVSTLLYNVRDTMGQCTAKWENAGRTSKPGQKGRGQGKL